MYRCQVTHSCPNFCRSHPTTHGHRQTTTSLGTSLDSSYSFPLLVTNLLNLHPPSIWAAQASARAINIVNELFWWLPVHNACHACSIQILTSQPPKQAAFHQEEPPLSCEFPFETLPLVGTLIPVHTWNGSALGTHPYLAAIQYNTTGFAFLCGRTSCLVGSRLQFSWFVDWWFCSSQLLHLHINWFVVMGFHLCCVDGISWSM